MIRHLAIFLTVLLLGLLAIVHAADLKRGQQLDHGGVAQFIVLPQIAPADDPIRHLRRAVARLRAEMPRAVILRAVHHATMYSDKTFTKPNEA